MLQLVTFPGRWTTIVLWRPAIAAWKPVVAVITSHGAPGQLGAIEADEPASPSCSRASVAPAVAGERIGKELGEELRAGDKRHFHKMIDECELMPDARRLIEVLHGRGAQVVLASSASQEDLDHYRAMLDADELIHAATSS